LNVIKIKLVDTERKAVLKKYTSNPEAYQLFLQGRFHHNKFDFTKAIEYYQAAIELESKYAIAYSGIASCYIFLWYFGSLPTDKSLPQMKQAAQHALLLDNEISESHLVMAMVKMWHDWDFTTASIGFKKAIELNPSLDEAYRQYAFCLAFMGNYPESMNQASMAYNIDSFSLLTNYQVGFIYWISGNHEKLRWHANRLIDLEPNFWGGHFMLGVRLFTMGRFEEALPSLELAVRLDSSISQNLGFLGAVYGVMGDKTKAREVLEKMQNMNTTQSVVNSDIAYVYAGLGELDMAFHYFEQGIEKREGSMLFVKYFVDIFPVLTKDPRTEQIIKRLGLPPK